VSVQDLLQAVLIQNSKRRNRTPRQVLPPPLIVALPVIDLQGMDLEQIEVKHERCRLTHIAGPARAELSFDAVKQAAPVPVIVAFAKDRSPVGGTLELPQRSMSFEHLSEHAGSGLAGAKINMEPWWHRGMHVEVAGVGAVTAVDFWRLRASKR